VVHGRDLGLVRVDQGQLEQVIINCGHGRDAMPSAAPSHPHHQHDDGGADPAPATR